MLRALDIWSADALLQGHTVPIVSIENVLIGLTFVCGLFRRYDYSAELQDHKPGDAGSHNRREVRFIIDRERDSGGYVYYGVERQAGVARLY